MDKIELYLLSGFLGAGKTTLLRQLVRGFPRQRLGVLVNEFGGLGFDGTEFRTGGVKLVEISGGSIFCACLKDGFVRTLKAFSQQPIDALIIENSGMADPAAMPRLLEGLRPYLQRDYEYRGNICLVDGTTFFDYADVLAPVRSQIETADALIVNKIDLLDQQTLTDLHRELAALNPHAPRMETVFAQVPAEFLRSALPGSGPAKEGTNTPHDRPAVFSLEAPGQCTAAQVEAFHGKMAGKLIRMKGFARTEAAWLDVQAVSGRLTLEPASAEALEVLPASGVRLVLIALPGTVTKAAVEAAWAACFGQDVRVRET